MATYDCREEAFGMAGGISGGFGVIGMIIGCGLWIGAEVNSTALIAGQVITSAGIILFVAGGACGGLE